MSKYKKVPCGKCKLKSNFLYSSVINKNFKLCMECHEKSTPCFECGCLKKYYSSVYTGYCRVCKYDGKTWYYICLECYSKPHYNRCKTEQGLAPATHKICFKCSYATKSFQCYDCVRINNKLNLAVLCADAINTRIATRLELKELILPEKLRKLVLYRRDCTTFLGN